MVVEAKKARSSNLAAIGARAQMIIDRISRPVMALAAEAAAINTAACGFVRGSLSEFLIGVGGAMIIPGIEAVHFVNNIPSPNKLSRRTA
jgi:hypothetical protein